MQCGVQGPPSLRARMTARSSVSDGGNAAAPVEDQQLGAGLRQRLELKARPRLEPLPGPVPKTVTDAGRERRTEGPRGFPGKHK